MFFALHFALVVVNAAFTPMNILPDKIVSTAAAPFYSLILSESGVVYGFGQSNNGQLVFGNVNVKLPKVIPVPDNKKIVQISAGNDHSLLLAEDGTVFGFGGQSFGRIGNGETSGYALSVTQIAVPNNKKIVQISAGQQHSFLLGDDGTVFAFGNPAGGRLGNGATTGDVLTPTAISIPDNKIIVYAAAGNTHSALVAQDGTVFTMGQGTNSKLCNGQSSGTVTTPTAITFPNNKKIVKAYPGAISTLFIAEDGTAFSCGAVSNGALGINKTSGAFNTPQELTTINSIKIVEGDSSLTGFYSALVSEDGSLYMFGSDTNGKLGLGVAITTRYAPTKVTIPGAKKIVVVAVGTSHTLSVAEDGTVFAMGNALNGKLGNDVDTGNQVTPLEIVSALVCNCNGHGTCEQGSSECNCTGNFNASSNCDSCLEGYSGENCTEIICDGISNLNVSAVCNGHGQCVEPDTCECDAGWDINILCSVTTCFKHRSNSGQVCSGRGKCVSENYCRCSQGYGGYKCQRLCTYCYKNSRF